MLYFLSFNFREIVNFSRMPNNETKNNVIYIIGMSVYVEISCKKCIPEKKIG